MRHTRVVVIGGGFGGLTLAKSLKKADIDLLLIDRLNHHLFQPLLYEVATATLSPGEIATPLREILRKQENAMVIMGEVSAVDLTEKKLTIANGDTVSYDYLIIAVGARHSYFGNDQWEQNAPGLKTISDALKIREQILISFEKAERLESDDTAGHLNFVVIGGGPTGVEMAGAIADIANRTLFDNFRKIRPEEAKIYLIEACPYILPSYPKRLSERAKKDLEKLGVKVLTNKKVTSITEEGVQVEDFFIPSKNVIWAAGNQASPLLKTMGVPLDRQGRVVVGPDLSIPGHPQVFVIGDAASVMGKDNKPLPAIAPAAVQEATYVAKIIKNQTPFEKRKAFSYFDKGSMATIGRTKAIVAIGKLQFTGFIAWLMWAVIHIMYLIGFRNRFGVMIEWLTIIFTGQRGVRLINRPIDKEIPITKR